MAKEAEKDSAFSPAFMTGEGGENFEQRIAAVFVLSLIIDGVSAEEFTSLTWYDGLNDL